MVKGTKKEDEVEPQYSLWTAPAGHKVKLPWDGIDLKALEKRLAEMDWDELKRKMEEEQTNCPHEDAMYFPIVNARVFTMRHSYHCSDCGLQSSTPMGIYKGQKQVTIEKILST